MSIMSKINYIKDMNVIGCAQPNIYVTIETAFAAGAPALLSLLVPGCSDIVKMKLGHSPWHVKGIKGLLKGAAPPFSAGANKFLYKIGYFTAERGLYYFMLADVTSEFFIQWQSLAFVAEQCPLPDAGTAYGYVAPLIYTPGFEGPLGIAPLHNVHGMANHLSGVQIFPGFTGSVAFSAEFDSWPVRGQGVSASTWTVAVDTGQIIMPSSTNQPPSQPHNQTAGHFSFDTTRAHTGTTYNFFVQNTGESNAQVMSGSYTVHMQGHATGVLPWGCKLKPVPVPSL